MKVFKHFPALRESERPREFSSTIIDGTGLVRPFGVINSNHQGFVCDLIYFVIPIMFQGKSSF
ncbi:hypothetical protein [Halobacillus mangrovi]|uniref:hypothetical protein n=1 Tax=Halobacillus mangrovi TaxID=402384 RepID=UPI003D988067